MPFVLDRCFGDGRLRHGDGVAALCLTADGQGILSLAGDDERRGLDPLVRCWDGQTGALLRSYRGLEREGRAVAASRDGRWVAAGDWKGRVCVWAAEGGAPVAALEAGVALTTLLFLDNGVLVSIADEARAWSLPGGARLWTAAPAELCSGAVLEDGSLLLVSLDEGGSRVSAETGEVLEALDTPGEAYALATVPGTGLVLIGGTAPAELGSLDGPQRVAALGPDEGEVDAVAVSPDGRLCALAASIYPDEEPCQLQLVDRQSGAVVHTLAGHRRRVRALAFTADGRSLLAGDNDGAVRLYEVATGAERPVPGHAGGVVGLAWSADGSRLLSCGWDRSCALVDGARGTGRHVEVDGTDVVVGVWSADARCVVVGTQGGTVAALDGVSGALLWRAVDAHEAVVSALLLEPGGEQAVSVGEDGRIVRWRVADGVRVGVLDSDLRWCSAALSPDGRQLLLGSIGRLRVWSWPEGEELRVVQHPRGQRVGALCPHPAGPGLAAVSGSVVLVHDLRDGSERVRDFGPRHVAGVVWDGPALWVCTALGDWLRWEGVGMENTEETGFFEDTELRAWVEAHEDDAVLSVALSADGQRLAVGTCVGRVGLFGRA